MLLIYEDIYFDNGILLYEPQTAGTPGLKTQIGLYNTKLSKAGNVTYFKAYQFQKNLDKDTKVSIQKLIKAGTIDSKSMGMLVIKSIMLLNKLLPVSKFDVLVTPESSAKLNKIILSVFKSKYPHLTIIDAGFVKRLGKNVTLHQDKIDKLDDKTRKSVQSNLAKALSNDDWKMKGIYSRNREFLDRVMDPTDDLSVKNKRVLIIDDVITKGTSMKDMARICEELGASFVAGYVFMAEK